jgi:hypothetical protein
MNGDQFITPANKSQNGVFSLRSTASKRDSLAAELERGTCPRFRTVPKRSNQLLHLFRSSTVHCKAAAEDTGLYINRSPRKPGAATAGGTDDQDGARDKAPRPRSTS